MVVDPRVMEVRKKWDLADAEERDMNRIRAALVTSNNMESVQIVDQQIEALNHLDLNNEQLVEVLESEVAKKLMSKGKTSELYTRRVKEELQVISKSDFAQSFAIAANIARFCDNMDIKMGMGRGSCVSSLVAYGLNIHQVDPIEYNLLFERFLTEDTTSQPDFDFDIESDKKILVENYLLAKYPRAAKLMVKKKAEIRHAKKFASDREFVGGSERRPAAYSSVREESSNEPTHKLSAEVEFLSMSVHPAGIGIVPEGIEVPYSAMENKYWSDQKLLNIDHKQAEKLGVKKFDLLSSKVVGPIEKAQKLISVESSLTKEQVLNEEKQVVYCSMPIDWHAINYQDAKSFELIKQGNTDGVYQLSSDFAKEICRQVKLEKFEDLVNLVALIRPGSKDYVHRFKHSHDVIPVQEARVHKMDAPDQFSDPKGIFKDTNGVVLFQEQGMQAMQDYLGVDKSKTNQLRKDMAKGNKSNPLVEANNFIKAAMDNGLTALDAKALYEVINNDSKFGFNRSHAVAYAQMTFKTAYLKAHYPEIFKEVFQVKEQQITNEQQISKDNLVVKSFKELYKKYELKQVDKALEEFKQKKSSAKTLDEITVVVSQEQEYLRLLPKHLKYENYDDKLTEIMKQAGGSDKVIDNMKRAAMHAMDNKIMDGKEIKQFLMSSNDINSLYKELKTSCEDHHIAHMNNNLKKIKEVGEIKIGNKIFKSQKDYIENEIQHPSNAFSDTARIEHI